MTSPLPDAVLAEMGAWSVAKGGVFFDTSWPDPYSLARELLAARKALRGLVEHGYCCECASPHSTDAEDAARSCLPESADG